MEEKKQTENEPQGTGESEELCFSGSFHEPSLFEDFGCVKSFSLFPSGPHIAASSSLYAFDFTLHNWCSTLLTAKYTVNKAGMLQGNIIMSLIWLMGSNGTWLSKRGWGGGAEGTRG